MIARKNLNTRPRQTGSATNAKTSRPKAGTTKSTNGQFRTETDSLGEVQVPADRLWGAQSQRSLEHFGIGLHLIPRQMIAAYATHKKPAAITNHSVKRSDYDRFRIIAQTCHEI